MHALADCMDSKTCSDPLLKITLIYNYDELSAPIDVAKYIRTC